MLIETHVLEVKSPNKPIEYLGFESEETARGAAYEALQYGVLKYEALDYVEDGELEGERKEVSVIQEFPVPQGTVFRVVSRDAFIVECKFRG